MDRVWIINFFSYANQANIYACVLYIKKKTKKVNKNYSYTYISEDIYGIFILNIEVFLFCSNTYFHDSFTYFYQSSAAFSPFLLYWGVCFFSLFLLQISKVFP